MRGIWTSTNRPFSPWVSFFIFADLGNYTGGLVCGYCVRRSVSFVRTRARVVRFQLPSNLPACAPREFGISVITAGEDREATCMMSYHHEIRFQHASGRASRRAQASACRRHLQAQDSPRRRSSYFSIVLRDIKTVVETYRAA